MNWNLFGLLQNQYPQRHWHDGVYKSHESFAGSHSVMSGVKILFERDCNLRFCRCRIGRITMKQR